MFDVSGKRAIITGGAQGFGLQFARRLLQKGCRVAITDVDDKKGLEAKKELAEQFGAKVVHFIKFDVTDKEGWNTMWDEAERILEGKIDILSNNAGINPGFGWEMCLKVMSVGATRGVFTAVERMSTKKGGNGGRIVNTASVAGIMNVPLGSELTSVGYSIAKQGLVALTRYFSYLEEDSYKTEGIKCYALAPYLADTNLVRSHIDTMVAEGKPVTHRKVEIRTIDDYKKAGMTRALTVDEVADAFMLSLKKDKNGAVFAVMPDMPLIEYPNEQNGVMLAVVATAKLFGSSLGVEVWTPRHFYIVTAVVLYAICALVYFLFRAFVF